VDFFDFVTIFGGLIQFVGLLIFGLAAGWFTLFAFKQPDSRWQLQIAVFLGLFLFMALLANTTSPGGLGGFSLGLGVGLLYWGTREKKPMDEEDSEEEE
jgi:hypothetical protein